LDVEVKGAWGKLHNEELRNLYFSPNDIKVIKSRRMRRAGMQHAWEKGQMLTKFWSENLKGRDHLENLGVHGRIIIQWWVGADLTGGGLL
jgi:hypothetical protein